jgi:hypothetical protein
VSIVFFSSLKLRMNEIIPNAIPTIANEGYIRPKIAEIANMATVSTRIVLFYPKHFINVTVRLPLVPDFADIITGPKSISRPSILSSFFFI